MIFDSLSKAISFLWESNGKKEITLAKKVEDKINLTGSVEVELLIEPDWNDVKDTIIRSERDHTNNEFYKSNDGRVIYFCYYSSKWAKIKYFQ